MIRCQHCGAETSNGLALCDLWPGQPDGMSAWDTEREALQVAKEMVDMGRVRYAVVVEGLVAHGNGPQSDEQGGAGSRGHREDERASGPEMGDA